MQIGLIDWCRQATFLLQNYNKDELFSMKKRYSDIFIALPRCILTSKLLPKKDGPTCDWVKHCVKPAGQYTVFVCQKRTALSPGPLVYEHALGHPCTRTGVPICSPKQGLIVFPFPITVNGPN